MKLIKTFHLWLSVTFGILIVLMCLSGAALVFEKEITASLHPELDKVKVEGEPLPLDKLLPGVLALQPDSARVASVEIPASIDSPYKVNVVDGSERRALMVDQYSGRLLGENVRPSFFRVMHSLHGSMLLGRNADGGIAWGTLVVGTTTLVMLIVLITGILLWWPRSRNVCRSAFCISSRRGVFGFWFSLHKAGGFYVSLFLMLMCITGLTWSFDWFSRGYYALLGAPTKTNKSASINTPKSDIADDYTLWDYQLNQVATVHPGVALTVSSGEVKVKLYGLGNTRATDIYRFDKATGMMTDIDRYADSSRRDKISGWTGSLHNGSWGGLTTRIIYLIASLCGVVLVITGYYFWIRRLRRNSGRNF